MVHLECRVLWIFLCPTNPTSKAVSLVNFKLPILCSHNTPQSSLSVGLSMHFRIIKSLLITYTKQQTITKPSLSLHTNKGQSAFSPTSQPTQIPNFASIISSFKIVGFLKNLRPFWHSLRLATVDSMPTSKIAQLLILKNYLILIELLIH